MKQILQVKRRKIPAVPASTIASTKSTSVQRTLHPLFTVTAEQRDAANRQRLRGVLQQDVGETGKPSTDKRASDDEDKGGTTKTATTRTRREIAFVERVPRLFNLARIDTENEDNPNAYIVPAFEEYVGPGYGGGTRNGRHNSSQQQTREKDKRSSQNSSKSSSEKDSRTSPSERHLKKRSGSKESGADVRISPKEKLKNASPKEKGKEKKDYSSCSFNHGDNDDDGDDVGGERDGQLRRDDCSRGEEYPSNRTEPKEERSHSDSSSRDHRERDYRCGGKLNSDRLQQLTTSARIDLRQQQCSVSVERVTDAQATRKEFNGAPTSGLPTLMAQPSTKKSSNVVVSPAATDTTAATSISASDQRLPDNNRDQSPLKEIVTNCRVPSMLSGLMDKSPSYTSARSVVTSRPADVDRRVLDWVDNCVSQGNGSNATKDRQTSSTATALTSSSTEPTSKQTSPQSATLHYNSGPIRDLQRAYLRLVDSEDCSDLVIETEERPIRAHKAILFVRCPKLAQIVSADSSFWQLSWCCSEAAILFLRYLYAADMSFVASVDGRVRKDLLTLCCQYQTDELAARLIRERSPSPPPSQHSQIPAKPAPIRRDVADRHLFDGSAGVLAPSGRRKRHSSPESLRPRRTCRDSEMSSENNSDTGSSSGKKTRMSITCETVSVTAPVSENLQLIRQSPRLPQPIAAGPNPVTSTPAITHISDEDDDDEDEDEDEDEDDDVDKVVVVERRAKSPAEESTSARVETVIDDGEAGRAIVVVSDDASGDFDDGRTTTTTTKVDGDNTAGSADQPIELGSSSDLFSDEEAVVGAMPPPLSPIQPTPRRHIDADDDANDRIILPSPPASLSQRISRPRKSASPIRSSPASPSSASSVVSSPSTSMRLLHRKSMSQPLIPLTAEDDDDDVGSSISGLTTPTRPTEASRACEVFDVTPLPRYSLMKTPEMHSHLDRYGIKQNIGKRRAVELLKHIYNSTHPEVEPPPPPPQPQNADTTSHGSSSSSSEESEGEIPLEETMVHDDDEEISDNVEDKILRYIKNTPDLYDKILRYEPLEVTDFKRMLREHGIRINDKTLVNFLDFHCINISFGAQRKATRSPKKARRKKTCRKPLQKSHRPTTMSQP